jgi:hypothetical protein
MEHHSGSFKISLEAIQSLIPAISGEAPEPTVADPLASVIHRALILTSTKSLSSRRFVGIMLR